ncbi:MAG TPA: segregation/condensation protein A [Gemmatimonadaceae bacterium]|nr:segregation/condensation protein A [Gemmatimonadaceae bacterium]
MAASAVLLAPPASFVVELDRFSGPLDLLLTLIRDEQVDIWDIPIARIAEQFLARIHALGLDAAADYLDMAARLLRIKTQLLLPHREGDEQWEDPRADLVRRLLEYQQMREVVDLLERLGEARRNRFARVVPAPAPPTDEALRAAPPAAVVAAMGELLAAVDRVLRQVTRPTFHTVIPRALDVEGALRTVRAVLADRARARWRELVGETTEPWQVLSLLLALLELARLGECALRQSVPFADVEIASESASAAA